MSPPHLSLPYAVRLALGDRRPDLGLGALALLTGRGLICVAHHTLPAEAWAWAAQDVGGVHALCALGVHLRDQHPPDAAVGLESSAEYELHFQDSYHPLIDAALAHGQPILAWHGSTQRPWSWGVVDARLSTGYQLRWPGEVGQISRAPLQCYALEWVEHTPADGLSLVRNAARAALRLLDPGLGERLRLITGDPARLALEAEPVPWAAWRAASADAAKTLMELLPANPLATQAAQLLAKGEPVSTALLTSLANAA